MSDIDQKKNELGEKIVSLVEDHWKKSESPLRLSDLGMMDGGGIAREVKNFAPSLRGFIDDNLSERVRLVQHPSKKAKIVALPINESANKLGMNEVFDLLLRVQGDAQTAILYPSKLWHAFRNPIESGKRRVVHVENPVSVEDIDQDAPIPHGAYEVDGSFIVADADLHNSTAINAALEKWAGENAIDLAGVRSGRNSRPPFGGGRPGGRNQRTAENLLDVLLDAISEEQKRKVVMPLDVIATLRLKKWR